MKILILSQLYYIEGRQDLVHDTNAVHYLVKYWTSDNDVLVINTYINYRNKIFRYLNKEARNYYFNDYSFEKDGVKVWLVENQLLTKRFFQRWNWKRLERKVNRILDEENFSPDIIVSHFPCYSYDYIGNIHSDAPRIGVLHESDTFHAEHDFEYLKGLETNFDACFCRSKRIYSYFRDKKLSNLREEIIYSGAPDSKEAIIDNSRFFSKKKWNIFYAGKFIERKHVDWIIEAVSRFPDVNLEFNIAGEGEKEAHLKNIVSELQLGERVHFLGKLSREETMERMRNSDIFCMPSTGETFGLVYLEAMRAGCITIGTKGEGIDGVLNNGVNGFLINGKEELIELFRRIFNEYSVEMLDNISKEAICTAEEYSEKNMSKRYLELIVSIWRKQKNDRKTKKDN